MALGFKPQEKKDDTAHNTVSPSLRDGDTRNVRRNSRKPNGKKIEWIIEKN
ncbi:hypothetical protein JCM19376_34640 [Fusibacter bizertensis]